jgi:hypothetical protein
VPEPTTIAAPLETHRAVPARRVLAAALLALCLASAATAARGASVLSDASVTPTSGASADVFTFSVHYTSSDSPSSPARSVWAEVAGITVTLTKVSGSAHDGTWQGTATLPAGSWAVTFHATASTDPQPDPLPGPTVTVIQPPPTPTPVPAPTPAPTPQPPAPPAPAPTSPSPPSAAASVLSGTPSATPRPALTGTSASGDPPQAAGSFDLSTDEGTPRGSLLAPLLIVGGTMSIAGAAVLARHWLVSRRSGKHR